MLTDSSNHPIFTEFKDNAFDFGMTICYPPGAGGNFLLNLLEKKDGISWTNSNEFRHDVSILNLLDFFDPLDQSEIDVNIDTAYDIAVKGRMTDEYIDGNRILRAHRLPLMFERVFTYHTNELIVITARPEHYWFVKVLAQNKIKMSTNWDVAAVIDMINNYHDSGINVPLDFRDFLSTRTYLLNKGILNPANREIPIFLEYFIWLKRNKLTASLYNLSEFINATMFTGELYIDYDRGLEVLPSRCYDRLTRIDYHDFFFNLRLPESGVFSDLSADEIRSYSSKNVEIVRDMMGLLSTRHRDDHERRLEDFLRGTALS